MKPIVVCLAAVAACGISGCGKPASQPITVGSRASTERRVQAEIVAQLLEHRLGTEIKRQTDMSSTAMAYEALLLGTIDIMPEDTSAIMVSVLKESLDPNPENVYRRVKDEMLRIGRIEVFDPLGVDRARVMVIRSKDAPPPQYSNLTGAARKGGWIIGTTSEFQESVDGQVALMGTYQLPLAVAPKVMPSANLYDALANDKVNMISGYDTDGALASNQFLVLTDDQKAFPKSHTCLMARGESLQRDPRIRPALQALSGKFTRDSMRQLDFEVDVAHHSIKDVADHFLRRAGLL